MADSYSKWVMTNSFVNNLQASINSGNKIEWVCIKTSDDTHLFADLAGFNDTTLATASIKQTATINTISINGNTVTITALFNNQDNQADYYIKTLFLVAKYNGTEFLAGATVANSASTAFRMPAASATEITEFTARPQITVSNSSTISATVDPVAAATNKRVDGLEATLQGEIDDINADKQSLWDTLVNYVTKAGTDTITGVKTFTQTIVGSITGNAGTATKLQTPRKLKVNLASTADQTFDGSTDQVGIGVDGILPVKNGGSGRADDVSTGGTKGIEITDFKLIQLPPSDNSTLRGFPFTAGSTAVNKPNVSEAGFRGWFTTFDLSNTIEFIAVASSGNLYVGQGSTTVVNRLVTVNSITWRMLSDNSTVVHNSGNETISGTKTFNSPIVGSITGNAGTATKLATTRSVQTNLALTSATSFDGTADIIPGVTGVLGFGNGGNGRTDGVVGAGVSAIEIVDFNSIQLPNSSSRLIRGFPFSAGNGALNKPEASETGYRGWFLTFDDSNSIQFFALGNGGTLYVGNGTTTVSTGRLVTVTSITWRKLSDDSIVVHNTGNETIGGVKTFSNWPVINGLNVSNGTNTSGVVRINASIQNQSDNNVPMAINTGSTLAVGGGEAANSYLTAMAAGAVPIGSTDAANEQLVLVGDAAVYIGAGYQSGGTTGKWWTFNQNGTVTAPSGNLLQEVNTGSITIKGSGTWFTTDTYLTLTYSGKVVSIQGELKTVADMSGGTSMSEILIPSGYRPVTMRTKQVGFNSSSASTKVFADVYFNPNGVISIDNVVVGANMTAWGTIPAGSLLNLSDTWVIA